MSVYVGVVFKYQKEEFDFVVVVSQLMNVFMILVISGQVIGVVVDVSKVVVMVEVILGNLGVVSGFMVDNIDQYSFYIKYVFVFIGVL